MTWGPLCADLQAFCFSCMWWWLSARVLFSYSLEALLCICFAKLSSVPVVKHHKHSSRSGAKRGGTRGCLLWFFTLTWAVFEGNRPVKYISLKLVSPLSPPEPACSPCACAVLFTAGLECCAEGGCWRGSGAWLPERLCVAGWRWGVGLVEAMRRLVEQVLFSF